MGESVFEGTVGERRSKEADLGWTRMLASGDGVLRIVGEGVCCAGTPPEFCESVECGDVERGSWLTLVL